MAARAGLQVTYICRDSWDMEIASIESGEADLGVLLKSKEREKKLLFSTPIDTTHLSYFARSQSDVDPSKGDLDHIVGVIKGGMSYEQLKNREGVRLQLYTGYREALFSLLAGETSLFAGEESMVLKQIRETGLEDRIKKVGKPFFELQRCLVVRKDNVQLLELMNKTMKDFVRGPEYQKIYLKWYEAPTPYWTNRRVIAVSAIFLIIAISGIAFWRYVSISNINKELIHTMSERRRAEEALRESEERFRLAMLGANDGLWDWDLQTDRVYYSPRWKSMLGYADEELENHLETWKSLVYPDDRESTLALASDFVEGRTDKFEVEFKMRNKAGHYLNILSRASLLRGVKGEALRLVGTHVDLSELKKAQAEIMSLNKELEQRVIERTAQLEFINRTLQDEIARHKISQEDLKESAQRFELAAASGQLGIWDWNVLSNVMIWNNRMFELYGVSKDEFPNSVEAWINSLHPDDSAKAIAESESALRGEKEFDTEFRVMHPNGTVKVLKANAIVIRDAEGKPTRMLGLNRDITELREMTSELNKSNEQLRNLAAHLQSVREEERTRIAREIHDELGQTLAAQKMDLSWFRNKYGDHKLILDKVNVMLDNLNSTVQAVKRICTELRPSILDDFGLPDAIQWQASEFQKRTRIECAVDPLPEDIGLGKERSTVLFRIFQETLTNVIKHAEATKVIAKLTRDNGNIVLEVTDNGKGITDEELSKPQSFGLIGMRERVYPWGGEIKITGDKDGGTTVKVSIPHSS